MLTNIDKQHWLPVCVCVLFFFLNFYWKCEIIVKVDNNLKKKKK